MTESDKLQGSQIEGAKQYILHFSQVMKLSAFHGFAGTFMYFGVPVILKGVLPT